jgi:hypothetical protein
VICGPGGIDPTLEVICSPFSTAPIEQELADLGHIARAHPDSASTIF